MEAKIKEAEQHAEEDKKRKEGIEVKNRAESLVYETEKSLKEAGDKIDASKKKEIEDAKDELSKAIESGNNDDIKAKTNTLTIDLKAEAIVAPTELLQYLGQGKYTGKVSDLAYHNSLMVQI